MSDGVPVGEFEEFGDSMDGCCHGADNACGNCCQLAGCYWMDFDFLLGWRHGIRTPPLVTSSVGIPLFDDAGALDDPNTILIYPTEAIGEQPRPGARIAFGAWLDSWQCWGVEGRYWMLANEATLFTATSNDLQVLARPFFNTDAAAPPLGPRSRLLAYPAVIGPGGLTISTDSEVLGGDALLHRTICKVQGNSLELVAGYQFARVNESVVISDTRTIVGLPLIPVGTTEAITDSFATENEYHAIVIGAAAKYDGGCWRIDVLAKLGLGNMQETATISGVTVTTPPAGAAPVVVQNGMLAQGVNLGTFTADTFSVSPELNVKFVYHVTSNVDVSAGYTFIYWSQLAQPGHQIDTNLNVPPTAFAIRDGEYWIHALTLGGTVRF